MTAARRALSAERAAILENALGRALGLRSQPAAVLFRVLF